MKTPFFRRLFRFRRDEEGGIFLIEFCILVPILFGAFMMAVEMGMYSMRQMYLDRGTDIAVRYIRLSTNTPIAHDEIKQVICDNAGFIEDCSTTLRLEMIPLHPRAFATFDQTPDCVDTSTDATPVRGFVLGREHEIMILRACVKFKPVFATSGLGYALEKDGSGRARMVAVSAFVQEPS
jgi:hypothetical protein